MKIWQDLMKKTRTNCSIHINQVSTPQFRHTKGMGVRQTSHPKEHGKVENHPWNSEASMDRWDMIGRLIFQIRVSLHSSWNERCSLLTSSWLIVLSHSVRTGHESANLRQFLDLQPSASMESKCDWAGHDHSQPENHHSAPPNRRNNGI